MTVAADLIAYIETLTIGQGGLRGEQFKLFPWQSRFVRGAFAPAVMSAALSIGRGNGKSTFTAAIGAATVGDGPLVEPGAENAIIASSFDQGLLTWRHIRRFLQPAIEREPKRYRIQDSANRASITDLKTDAMLRVLGSDPARMHGLAPAMLILDELAQWPKSTLDRALAALETSRGKIPGSRLIAIGTRPASPDHAFQVMLDGSADYAQVHDTRPSDPPFRKKTWVKANPSLSRMPDLETAIRRESKLAKLDGQQLAQFKALRLNAGVSDTSEQILLEPDTWVRIEGDAPADGDYCLGIDLGTNTAMSAAAAYWPSTSRLETFAVYPEIPNLAERGLRDGIGGRYVRMHERNELLIAGERVSDIGELLNECRRRWGVPSVAVSDRWREAELRQSLAAVGFPVVPLEARGQGFKDGAEDVRRFRRACLGGRVTPVESLLLRSALSEARVVGDASGVID